MRTVAVTIKPGDPWLILCVDMRLRNYLLGFRNRDNGHAIEKVVYFELLRRGHNVTIGKVDNAEVDFIATKTDEKLYIQVTESMVCEDIRRRELAPLQKIRHNYEKNRFVHGYRPEFIL